MRISYDDDILKTLKEIKNLEENSHFFLSFPEQLKLLCVRGDQYHKTITTDIMDALSQRQANINKLYAILLYGHVRNLSDDEKKQVQISFSIEAGSSNFIEENTDRIIEALKEAVHKMSGKQILSIFIVGLLLYFGSDVWKYTLDTESKRDEKKFIINLISEINHGHDLLDGHKEYTRKIRKIANKNDEVKILQHIVPKGMIDDDKHITEGRIDGDYKILSISAKKDFFSITVKNLDQEQTFSARLDTLNENDIQAIQKALFSRQELSLKINARYIDGKISSAFIVGVD